MQKVDATNVDIFKSHSKNKAVAVQQRELLAGGHIHAGDKGGLFTLQAPPSPPFGLLDNCVLPLWKAADRWPWRPTSRSCSLSMTSLLSHIQAVAFIPTTACSGTVHFPPFLHFTSKNDPTRNLRNTLLSLIFVKFSVSRIESL